MKFLLTLLISSLAAFAQTFPLAGVVVDGVTGKPMERVRVTMRPSARPAELQATVTAADGTFFFEVPKGMFQINAEYHGNRQVYGQTGPAIGYDMGIYTGPDYDASHLVFRWFAPGVIAGKVTDDRGEPVAGAQLQLSRASTRSGQKQVHTVAYENTNDLGEYRFPPQPGGTYYLVASMRTAATLTPGADEQGSGFPPVYYPNAADASGSKPLELAPGAEVAADFHFSRVTGSSITVDLGGNPTLVNVNLIETGVGGVDAYVMQQWMSPGSATMRGIPPGHYILTGARDDLFDRREVEVSGTGTSVSLDLKPMPSVSGQVTYDDPQRLPHRGLSVRLINEANGSIIAGTVDSAGAFSIARVQPGKWRVILYGPEGFFVTKIAAEGAVLKDERIELVGGAKVQLNIVGSGAVSRVRGFVMDGERPVPGVLAVLVPKSGPIDAVLSHSYQTDSNGAFAWPAVREGDYLLFALDRIDVEYSNRAAMQPYLEQAKIIHVGSQMLVVENAPLQTTGH